MEQNDYYEQTSIWSHGREEYQVQVLHTLFNIIPEDTKTILDVGCGNGLLTNPLSQFYDVTGLDISEEALSYIAGKKVKGSLLDIPFGDKSFDLVMINDTLEHIADADYPKALVELQRVSKKYILVTVPLEEDIESKTIRCDNCGESYHINQHQRSYQVKDLEGLVSQSWGVAAGIFYTGDTNLPPHDATILFKKALGWRYDWPNAMCPKCGHQNDTESDKPELFLINAARQTLWNNESYHLNTNRSEVSALYIRNGIESNIAFRGITPTVFRASLCDIDFTNSLQKADEMVEGSRWAKFQCGANTKLSKEGVCLVDPAQEGCVSLIFPLLQKQDRLMISFTNPIASSMDFHMKAFDAMSGLEFDIYPEEKLEDTASLTFALPFQWMPTKFGYQINVYVKGEPILAGIMVTGNDHEPCDFLKLLPGHNVYLLSDILHYSIFCSDDADSSVIPICTDPHDKNLLSAQECYMVVEESLQCCNVYRDYADFVLKRMQEITLVLEETERQRVYLESAIHHQENNYISLEKKLVEINALLEEKEKIREILESKASNLEKELNYSRNILRTRKVQKVLVLSHMFPSDTDYINGSFVHEQVKSLIQDHYMDMRVISCRPYWMNGIHIPNLLKANSVFQTLLNQCQWEEYDFVPTMYLPYRVGNRFIRHSLHSYSYTNSIMKVIDRVWAEFKFDLVHAHTSYLDGSAARAVSDKFKVPYVITEHTGPFSVLTAKYIVRNRTLSAIRGAAAVWGVSDAQRDTIKEYFPNNIFTQAKIGVMYNGVDTNRFRAKEQLKSDKEASIAFRLYYVGYLEEVKDPLNLVRAFAILTEKRENISLVIVGGGTLRNAVEEEISKLKLDDRVHLVGMKSRDEVAALLRTDADMLVMPSRAETFGVSLIEAMACGIPVVATRCGGPESIIKEDYIGELCEKENPEALAEAITEVIENYGQYDSKRISSYAIDCFSNVNISGELIERYQNI